MPIGGCRPFRSQIRWGRREHREPRGQHEEFGSVRMPRLRERRGQRLRRCGTRGARRMQRRGQGSSAEPSSRRSSAGLGVAATTQSFQVMILSVAERPERSTTVIKLLVGCEAVVLTHSIAPTVSRLQGIGLPAPSG